MPTVRRQTMPLLGAVTVGTGYPPCRCAEMSARPERSEGSESKACIGLTCHFVKPFDRLRANGCMQSTALHEQPFRTAVRAMAAEDGAARAQGVSMRLTRAVL